MNVLPKRHWLPVAALLLLLAVLAGGCQGLRSGEKEARFDDAMRAYTGALRWGHYNTLTNLVRARDGSPRDLGKGFKKDLRVAYYRVRSSQVSPDLGQAVLEGTLGYFSTDSGKLKELEERQLWWYDPESGGWFVDTPPPAVLFEH